MRVRKLPKRVLDLFPMWEYRCPICHTYVELSTNICPRCRTLFDEKKWRVPPRFLATKKAMSDYAHNVLARGLDEEQRELLFRHFTELFSDGFESGNFSAWTDTEVHGDATLTVVSDQKHHGTYSAKAYVTGSDGRYATCYKDFTTQTTLYYRGYFRFNELPSSGNEIGPILSARTSDGNDWAKVYAKNDAGQMQWKLVNDDAAATHTYDATINAGQWYCVELKTTKGSPGNLQLYIDNDKIIDETESFNRDIARIQVGLSWYTQANTMWFDCFVLADAGPIGMEGETDLSSNFKVQKTFGKVAIGGSNQARSADFAFAVGGTGGYFTLNEPGEVTKIRIYCRSGTEADNKKACIYAVDAGGLPTTLKGVSAEVEVPVSPAAWYDFAFSPAVFLTAGNYRLGWNSESQALYVWFDSGDADAAKYKSSTYPNFPNPFGTPDGGSDREYSIYALYTPSQLASANLSSNFYVGGKGSKDLSSNFTVGGLQADSTNLSSTFFAVSESTISTFGENLDELVVVEEATEDLTSSFAIQKPGSADVSSTFIVGQGYADLSSNFTIGLTADSTDLSSQFIVQQLGSKDLSSTFVISKSSEKDLSSSFTIQKPDEANLTSTFVVQQPGESNLSSQFVVQQTDEATLQSTFIVQTPGEVDLSSTIFIYKVGEGNLSSTLMVRNVGEADLSSTFHIGGIGSADLSSTFTLPFTDSADLSSVFTIIQPGEANLSLTFTIQKPDEVDLSSTFTILTPDETDLSSQFIVRSIGEKNLSSTFIVRNVGEADLSSTCVVLNIGEQDLSATFIVQQPSEKDLSSTFTIITPGEADLSSTLDVQRPGEVDLSSTFIVGQGYADLSSNFFVGKLEGSADLSSNFEVQQPGEANLSANFKVITRIVSDYKDNLDELEVYEVASKDLTSNVTVRNIASATLSGSFIVQQPGSADLSSNFVVFYFWKDLPANFIVVPYVVETKLFDDQTTDIALIDAETTTVTLRDYAKAKEMLRHY